MKLAIFQGIAGPGVFNGNLIEGQKFEQILRFDNATSSIGSDASSYFSKYVIEDGKIVQLSSLDLSTAFYIGVLTDPQS